MSDLLIRQQEFFAMFMRLASKIISLGYQATFGDAYRDPRATFPYSHPKSLHGRRLAVDINLFVGQHLLVDDEAEDAHRIIHGYWTEMGGSKIIEGDWNHYSVPWEGMR